MNTDTLYRFIWLSRPLMQQAEQAVERTLQGTGITVRTRAVMEILHTNGALTVPALAKQLHIQRQYVQVMVNEGLKTGLLTRRPNPDHARSVLIDLTKDGATTIQDIIAKERRFLAKLGADLDPAEVETALRLAQTLLEKLQNNGSDPNP